MSQIKFKQIVYQVIKYAPTQLLHATYAKVKKFYGLRVDDYGRIYARATTYSTKLYDKKRRVWYRKITPKVYDTFIMINPKRKNVVLSCSCPDFCIDTKLHCIGAVVRKLSIPTGVCLR